MSVGREEMCVHSRPTRCNGGQRKHVRVICKRHNLVHGVSELGNDELCSIRVLLDYCKGVSAFPYIPLDF